jgi:hypothetical protein
MNDSLKLDAATKETLARLASDVNAIRHTLDALIAAFGTIAETVKTNIEREVAQRAADADVDRLARVAKFKATSEGKAAAAKGPTR